jgi:Cu/Zn superoxide dismutase
MIFFARSTPTALLIALLAGAGVLAGCDQSGMDGPEPETFTAPLTALNNSGVSGEATVTVEGTQFTVTVDAQGTEAENVHAQHIHGFASDVSSCPTAEADTSGDGSISVGEGAPAYGGILVPLDGSLDEAEGLGELETFPTGNGSYAYQQSIATGDIAVNDDRSFGALTLGNHAIVVHGQTVDGEYEATRPVACGTLSQ